MLSLSYPEDLGSAIRTDALDSWLAILQSDRLRIFDFYFLLAFDTIRFRHIDHNAEAEAYVDLRLQHSSLNFITSTNLGLLHR